MNKRVLRKTSEKRRLLSQMNKKGFEFGFGWLFAIIVGAAIIFIAIYATVQLVNLNKDIQNTEAAYELNSLLTSVTTNLDSQKESRIFFNTETRMYNECDNIGSFGHQAVSVSIKSGIGKEWQDPAEQARSYTKYIFSSKVEEGKELRMFVVPFNLPFKIADLIIAWNENKNYCFVDASEDLKNDLEILNSENFNFTDDVEECKKDSKKVCFYNADGCDIIVEENRVRKDRKSLYYTGNLIYGAIFSDPEIYECQVKRLMKRASSLSLLYIDKTRMLAIRGCSSTLEPELTSFSNQAMRLNSSIELNGIIQVAQEMEDKNDLLLCNLWGEK